MTDGARKRKRESKLPLCGGEKRKGGKCTQPAGWGTQHPGAGFCKLHGGSGPAAQVKGLVELARREQSVMGAPLSIEPQDAILECIRIAAGEVAYASERIAELEASETVGPVSSRTVRRVRTEPADKGEESQAADQSLVEELRDEPPALHIWIQVRRQAMDRLVSYSFAALKAGIEERRVRVAEQQGMLLAQAIQGILRELGIQDRPEVAGVVRKHLTRVAGQSVTAG